MDERPLALLGFMGAGKTTLGAALAQRSGRRFVDLDEAVEAAIGQPISRIFATQGERAFRDAELRVLNALLTERSAAPLVIAFGGGTFAQPDVRQLCEQRGVQTLWLRVPWEILRARLDAPEERAKRPLTRSGEESLKRLLDEREALYALAQGSVDASGPVEVVLDRILAWEEACETSR